MDTKICVILDLCMIADLSWMEVSSQEESACFFTAVDPMNIPMLTLRCIVNEPRMIPHTMKWRTVRNTVFWLDLQIAQDMDWNFINHRAMRHDCTILCEPKVS